jgi:hypothetical protein
LDDFSDGLVGNIAKLVGANESIGNLLESGVINFFFNLVLVIFHFFFFELQSDALVDD